MSHNSIARFPRLSHDLLFNTRRSKDWIENQPVWERDKHLFKRRMFSLFSNPLRFFDGCWCHRQWHTHTESLLHNKVSASASLFRDTHQETSCFSSKFVTRISPSLPYFVAPSCFLVVVGNILKNPFVSCVGHDKHFFQTRLTRPRCFFFFLELLQALEF